MDILIVSYIKNNAPIYVNPCVDIQYMNIYSYFHKQMLVRLDSLVSRKIGGRILNLADRSGCRGSSKMLFYDTVKSGLRVKAHV